MIYRLNYQFANGQDAGSCNAYANDIESALDDGKHWESEKYGTRLVSVELIPQDTLGRELRDRAVIVWEVEA